MQWAMKRIRAWGIVLGSALIFASMPPVTAWATCPISGPFITNGVNDLVVGCNGFTLTWAAAAPEVYVAGYYVYWHEFDWGTNPEPAIETWTKLNTFMITGTSLYVPGSTSWNGKTIAMKVKAVTVDTSCPVSLSPTQSFYAMYRPGTPTGVSVTALPEGQIRVAWDHPTDGWLQYVRVDMGGGLHPDFDYAAGSCTFPAPACGSRSYGVYLVSIDGCQSQFPAGGSATATPTTPALASPSNGASIATTDITFSWSATCATSYDLQVADNAGFASPVVSTTVTTPGYTWQNAPFGSFYWRVRSTGAGGTSGWSATRSFTHPVVITVTSPNGGESVVQGVPTTITWTTSGSIPSVNIDYSLTSGTTWSNIATGVPNSLQYPWTPPITTSSTARIRVSGGAGTDMSDANFNIVVPPLPPLAMEWSRDWITRQAHYPSTVVEPNLAVNTSFHGATSTGGTALVLGSSEGNCAWVFEEIDPSASTLHGLRSALAIGAQRTAHVAYVNEAGAGSYEFRYNRGTRVSAAYHNWSSYPSGVLLGSSTVLTWPAIALDSGGNAHIVCPDATGLKYFKVSPTLVVTGPEVISTLPKAGQADCSIAINGQGEPCVAFTIDYGTGQPSLPALGYARRVSGTWTAQASQVVSNEMGTATRIALDATGQPRIACMARYTGRLTYAKWSNATSSWGFTQVTNEVIGDKVALVLDASGLAHMAAWLRDGNGAYVPSYVRENASAPNWVASAFDTTVVSAQISNLDIGFDAGNSPVIGYTTGEGTRYSVEVARGVPGTADVTPPAAITNLTVTTGKTSAVVSWTATGDDGTVGTAANYDVRYALTNITDIAAFSSATPIASACPMPSGSGDCAGATGLARCSRYYFAARVRDNAGNWSGLSNVGTAVTKCSGTEVFCDPGGGPASMQPAQGEEASEALPTRLALAITSPNPARGAATLRLDVPASAVGLDARVSVYDAQGRRVRTLYSARAMGGSHALNWDLRNDDGVRVRQGAYFVRLQIGTETIRRTLILLD